MQTLDRILENPIADTTFDRTPYSVIALRSIIALYSITAPSPMMALRSNRGHNAHSETRRKSTKHRCANFVPQACKNSAGGRPGPASSVPTASSYPHPEIMGLFVKASFISRDENQRWPALASRGLAKELAGKAA